MRPAENAKKDNHPLHLCFRTHVCAQLRDYFFSSRAQAIPLYLRRTIQQKNDGSLSLRRTLDSLILPRNYNNFDISFFFKF